MTVEELVIWDEFKTLRPEHWNNFMEWLIVHHPEKLRSYIDGYSFFLEGMYGEHLLTLRTATRNFYKNV